MYGFKGPIGRTPTLGEELKEIGKPTPEQKPHSGQEHGNLLRGIARLARGIVDEIITCAGL
jgi:hypothetical protein